MLTKGQEYTDQGQDYFEERYRQRVLHHLTHRAAKPNWDCAWSQLNSPLKTPLSISYLI